MEWFRHYHGLCTDPKLHIIARTAKVPRGLVVGAWCAILEQASQASDRGDASGVTPVSLAFLIDVKPHVAERIFNAIWASDLIADGRVAAWDSRQKSSDDVQKRVSNHRARKSKPLEQKETSNDCNVTNVYREEKIESVSKDTAPNGADHSPEADMKRAVYEHGKRVLGAKAGGQITKAIAKCGLGATAEIIEATERERAIDPAAFFEACVKRRTQPGGVPYDAFAL